MTGEIEDAGTQDDLEDVRHAVDAPHLDLPLAQTLAFEALSQRPTGSQIAQVQRYAAGGRYGRGWRRAVESRSVAPLPMALGVGGVVAVLLLIAVVVAAVQGDSEAALVGLLATAVASVVAGGLGAWGAAAARRRLWRRHARVAAFAEANGVKLRLSAPADAVPPAVRSRPGENRRSSVHADVMSARVGGLLLLTGTRTTDVKRGESTSTFHQMWAGLRFEVLPGTSDVVRSGLETLRAEMQAWCEQQFRRDPVELTMTDGWLVLSSEGLRDDLPVIETLLAGIDLALVVIEENTVGPDDVQDAPV